MECKWSSVAALPGSCNCLTVSFVYGQLPMLQFPGSNLWSIPTGMKPHGKTTTKSCSVTFVISRLVINVLCSSQGDVPCKYPREVGSHQKYASSPQRNLIQWESWVEAGEAWILCDYLDVHAHPLISEGLGSVGIPLKCNDPTGFKHTCSNLHSTAGTQLWMPGTQGSAVLYNPAFTRLDWWRKSSIFSSLKDG